MLSLALMLGAGAVHAQAVRPYPLGPGDVIRITVFQNPDMTTETRVTDSGSITFPLVGAVDIAGMTASQAEQKIATALKNGGFVLKPQVNVVVSQFRSRQVSVLGYVNRPGRYPLEDQNLKLADVLALAGGVSQMGGDTIIVTRTRGGKEERFNIDIDSTFVFNDIEKNIEVLPGDTFYVPRYPMFYIYGQAQRPGQFRLERNMTVQQALSVGGGVTLRGTEKGLTIRRRDVGGKVETLNVGPADRVMQDDVIYVKESVF
ncbi:MAG: polysaccharide export protein EpsE [Burkholderiales bacterium]|nr:polysaccharide export protein EpsE [Burkholderiales bacterium]